MLSLMTSSICIDVKGVVNEEFIRGQLVGLVGVVINAKGGYC